MGGGRFVVTSDDALAIGPLGGCVFCAYESERNGRDALTPATPATTTIDTPQGPRDVCAAHATAGRWSPRAARRPGLEASTGRRRVSKVGP